MHHNKKHNISSVLLNKWYNKKTKTLTIPSSYNEELKGIPKDTQIIIFENEKNDRYSKSDYFNKKYSSLPYKLNELIFSFYFNKKINNLPKSLIELILNDAFNQKVDYLPQNLTYLTFGYNFNQKVDYLPQNLTYLTFGYKF
jgi:Leucine-rich repeat (LRR) protein